MLYELNNNRRGKDLPALLAAWPYEARMEASRLSQKYGPPTEIARDLLRWRDTGCWTTTRVLREGVFHCFPTPHTGVVEQAVPYRIPMTRMESVVAFDGSISFDRTSGLVSVRHDCEAMNFLAINLMHRIVEGGMDVCEARAEFARQAAEYLMEGEAPFARELQFVPASAEETADVDEAVITEALLKEIGNGNRLFGGSCL